MTSTSGGAVPAAVEPAGVSATKPVSVLRAGDTSKPDPFTICIVANPAIERSLGSGRFIPDPIISNPTAFLVSAQYIHDALFGTLPGQREKLLADPSVVGKVRVISLFVSGLIAEDRYSLVGEDPYSTLLMPRRSVFDTFLAGFSLRADVAYAVSASQSHTGASAYYTTDDDSRPGVAFILDGVARTHRYYCQVPGTVAIHHTSRGLTALHEFSHALSSYTNGMVVDLYVDFGTGLNKKAARPIPGDFAVYNGTTFKSDMIRDGLSYPPGWSSFHCEPHLPVSPVVMDNYWAATMPDHCEHDKITRQFLLDRVRAKTIR